MRCSSCYNDKNFEVQVTVEVMITEGRFIDPQARKMNITCLEAGCLHQGNFKDFDNQTFPLEEKIYDAVFIQRNGGTPTTS